MEGVEGVEGVTGGRVLVEWRHIYSTWSGAAEHLAFEGHMFIHGSSIQREEAVRVLNGERQTAIPYQHSMPESILVL